MHCHVCLYVTLQSYIMVSRTVIAYQCLLNCSMFQCAFLPGYVQSGLLSYMHLCGNIHFLEHVHVPVLSIVELEMKVNYITLEKPDNRLSNGQLKESTHFVDK